MTQAAILAASGSPGTTTGFKNKIINGNMVIDQRNSGASFSSSSNNAYNLDRWYNQNNSGGTRFTVQQNAGSVTPPAGFTKYLGVTSTSAYSVISQDVIAIGQKIEGYNIADLAWGAANAKTVTLSFWVRSSLTGTFGGSVSNDSANRFYPFTYTISSANTWEQKTVTIAGDTTGTWNTTTSSGIQLLFNLGTGADYSGTAGAWTASPHYAPTGVVSVVGTNGATWYVTGVQLEVGTTATNFDFRSYAQEFQLCLRYYQRIGNGTYVGVASGLQASTTQSNFCLPTLAPMRAAAALDYSNLIVTNRRSFDVPVTSINYVHVSITNIFISVNHTGAGAQDLAILLTAYNSGAGYLQANAEL